METDGNLKSEVGLTAAKFAERHIKPVAADVDHSAPRFPEQVFVRGLEAGFDRFALPEELGGHGFRMAELCALIETLARTCAGHAMVFGIHAAAVKAIVEAGGENAGSLTKEIFNSRRPVAVAIPEPLSPDEIDLNLASTRDGLWNLIVTGTAGLAFNADRNGYVVVFAAAPDGRPVAMLVECGGETCRLGPFESTLGLRAVTAAEFSLDRHPVVRTSIIAEGESAMNFYRSLARHLCLVVSAAAAGVMAAACDTALEYAAARWQGGKMIVDHSHLRSILGGMSAGAAASEGAVFHAASAPDDDRVVIGTKRTVTDCAVRTCSDAVQVLGGYGYMRDYGLEKSMRDAAVLSLLPFSNARCELLLAAMGKEKVS